jgi:hypothetical protein
MSSKFEIRDVTEGPTEAKFVHGARLMFAAIKAKSVDKSIAAVFLDMHGKEAYDDVFHIGIDWSEHVIRMLVNNLPVKPLLDNSADWAVHDDCNQYLGAGIATQKSFAQGALWVATLLMYTFEEGDTDCAGAVAKSLLSTETCVGNCEHLRLWDISAGDRYTQYLMNKYVVNRPGVTMTWEEAKVEYLAGFDGDFDEKDYKSRLGWSVADMLESERDAPPPVQVVQPVQPPPPPVAAVVQPTAPKPKTATRFITGAVPAKKFQKGAKCGAMCIHAVGGETGVTVTAARRKRVLADHAKALALSGKMDAVQCSHHVGNWKSISKGVLVCVRRG